MMAVVGIGMIVRILANQHVDRVVTRQAVQFGMLVLLKYIFR